MNMIEIAYQNHGVKLSDRLLVGVSGGPDSVALLHLLKDTGFTNITVVHLDHQIRKESKKDAVWVKKMAKRLGFSCIIKSVNILQKAKKNKENLEELSRDIRYRFFRDVKEKRKATYIVTAHQADDQVETVLMNMIRGCGLDGLMAMSVVENDLYRPLLPYSKQEILAYLKSKKIQFREDKTNQDPTYRRNFLRLQVIPRIKELNPNFIHTMANNISIWQRANEYVLMRTKEFVNDQAKSRWPLRSFVKLPEFLQETALRLLFERTHGNKKNLSQDHLRQILKVIHTNVSGKRKEFGPGKILERKRDFFQVKTSA